MSRRRLLVLVLALVALLGARPAVADVARPLYQKRLANGLRVVVAPDPAGADVSVLVRYETGARDEPAGLEGLAHLVEHLLFMGSRHAAPGAHLRLLEQAGATNLNGTTTIDATRYFETLPPERLALGLWLESDRMGYGLDRLDERTLQSAKAEVLNERREHVDEVALGALSELTYAELFPSWHPYHHLPGGTPASIARITLGDVRAFFNTWYGPANAVLVIAGKVDPSAVSALVDRYFATLPARPPPARPPLPAVATSPTTVLAVGANVTRSEIRLAWVTPRFGAPGDAELDLAAAILVDRGAGWLEKALFQPTRLCSDVRAFQQSWAFASVFEIHATVAAGRATTQVADEVLRRILLALRRFEGGVSDGEIQRARTTFANDKLFRVESSLGQAMSIASWMQIGPLPASLDGLLSRHAAIQPAAVRDAVRMFLGSPRVATIGQPMRDKPPFGAVLSTREVRW